MRDLSGDCPQRPQFALSRAPAGWHAAYAILRTRSHRALRLGLTPGLGCGNQESGSAAAYACCEARACARTVLRHVAGGSVSASCSSAMTQFRPSFFARYSARSARQSRRSMLSPCSHCATPKLAARLISLPLTGTRTSISALRSSSASANACARSPSMSRQNSSPPRRPMMPLHRFSCAATAAMARSPRKVTVGAVHPLEFAHDLMLPQSSVIVQEG
jgi:hypothetical protein